MEEKIVKDYEIIEKMKEERKSGNHKFYIFLICFITSIFIAFLLQLFMPEGFITEIIGIWFLPVLALLFGIYLYISRNKNFNKKVKEVGEYSIEINEYCKEIRKDLYVTNNYIMYITGTGGSSKNKIIAKENIEGYDVKDISSDTEYCGKSLILEINLKTNKMSTLAYSEELEKILEEVIHENNLKELENCKVESKLLKEFYIFDDRAEGTLFIPAFNKDCNIYVHKTENALEYAEKTAMKANKFTFADFKDALICSVWAYQDYLREYGYEDDLYEANMPLNVTKDNIINYMELSGISSCDLGVSFYFEVPWEVEHGFSWVFKGKELIYVGTGQDVKANSSEEILSGFWNYAKKYHKGVILTGEDWDRIKESYQKTIAEENEKKEKNKKV